jgi:hypothetical protein
MCHSACRNPPARLDGMNEDHEIDSRIQFANARTVTRGLGLAARPTKGTRLRRQVVMLRVFVFTNNFQFQSLSILSFLIIV